jgi:hypothetical protein
MAFVNRHADRVMGALDRVEALRERVGAKGPR